MKRFIHNSRGVITAQTPTIKTGGHITIYTKPDPSIRSIDRLREGSKPKICITRKQGGIGDVLMTTPVVKAISTKYEVQVDYGTDFDYLNSALPKCLMHNPYINKVMPWRDVDPANYDAVIDLTCPCIAHEKPRAQPVNRVDLFARHARIHLQNTELDYYVTQEEEEWAQEYLHQHNLTRTRPILIQPSSSTTNRDMPIDLLKKSIANIMQLRRDVCPIIITHGSDNIKTTWSFADVHVFHNYDIRHIAAIMTQCKLTVCPDSSILHIAAALHHPTFTLFGPTDPRARVNYHPEAVAYWPAKELKNYPCVGPDSLVKTSSSYKPISEIKIGDLVKVNSGIYSEVTEVHKNKLGDRKLYELTVFGSHHHPIQATEDHKFLVSKRVDKSKHFLKKKHILNPQWIKTSEIKEKDYMCIPKNWAEIQNDKYSPELCWIFGLYLAEGYLKKASSGAKQIILSGSVDEKHIDIKLKKCLKNIGIHHYQLEYVKRKPNANCKDNNKTVNRIITNKKLFTKMENLFGLNTTAHTKKFPSSFYSLTNKCLAALLDGLFKGDGYEYLKRNTKYQILSTVSRELAFGTQELLSRFGYLGKVYFYKRDTNFKKDTHIYRVNICFNGKNSRHIVDENYIYVPVKSNKVIKDIEHVYDITVDKIPTFTINNLAVFDCWYENPRDGYLCWKRMEQKTIVESIIAMLDDKPLPVSRDFVTFGKHNSENQLFEIV